MRVLVLGAGAVGLTVAAMLSRVCEVHAICREKHAAVIRKEGFRMTGIWGEGNFSFNCGESVPEDRDFDYVLITAKSIDTHSICEQFRDVLADHQVASLQNGLGNEEIIARYTDHVIGGTIITGFEWKGAAEVHVTVEAGPVRLGRFPAGLDPAVQTLVNLFCHAGVQAEGSDTIRADLWAKTLYNCALNPLGAVMEVPYGDLAQPAAWRIVEEIVREGFSVVHAEGVRLPWGNAEAYLHYLRSFQLPATATHRSSMLQDILRGRKTEIDFMNGAVVARARERCLNAAVNATMADLIRFKEALSTPGGPKQ